jgi:magnesium transporter
MSNNKRLTRYKKLGKSPATKPHLYDYHYNQPGTMPGLMTIDENANPTEIFLINYNSQQATRVNNLLPKDCLKYLSNDSISWIDIVGLGNEDKLQVLGEMFHLHPLTLEDIVNIPQRPKVEEYDNYILIK